MHSKNPHPITIDIKNHCCHGLNNYFFLNHHHQLLHYLSCLWIMKAGKRSELQLSNVIWGADYICLPTNHHHHQDDSNHHHHDHKHEYHCYHHHLVRWTHSLRKHLWLCFFIHWENTYHPGTNKIAAIRAKTWPLINEFHWNWVQVTQPLKSIGFGIKVQSVFWASRRRRLPRTKQEMIWTNQKLPFMIHVLWPGFPLSVSLSSRPMRKDCCFSSDSQEMLRELYPSCI